MDEYSKLKKNTLIIAIANLGSNVISFILAPLYSFLLTPNQFGTVDVAMTTISLVLPIITLDVQEATFRFSLVPKREWKSVFTASLAFSAVGFFTSCLIFPFLFGFHIAADYLFLIFLIIVNECFSTVVKQFARGTEKMATFAFSGVVSSVFILLGNLIFMVLLRWGIQGYFLSILLGYFLSHLYVIVRLKCWRYISIQSFQKSRFFAMARYSLPLMPANIMWWIMNVSDRYVIKIILGSVANGIYAVSYKFPTVLSILETIFYQAWQISAINEKDSQGSNKFYSQIFNSYYQVLVTIVIVIMVFIKQMIFILFQKRYASAWYYAPILLYAVVFHALGGYLGVFYNVSKKTRGALVTTVVGALVNLLINIVTTPYIGLFGPSISTLISYIVVVWFRVIDTRKYVKLRFNKFNIVFWIIMFAIQLALYYQNGVIFSVISLVIALISLWLSRKIIYSMLIRKRIVTN